MKTLCLSKLEMQQAESWNCGINLKSGISHLYQGHNEKGLYLSLDLLRSFEARESIHNHLRHSDLSLVRSGL